MTPEEYRDRLARCADAEFEKFNAEFGGGPLSREERVREFARDPRHERVIAHLLGLKTEEVKVAETAQRSAWP
jgi:hypothetical protein